MSEAGENIDDERGDVLTPLGGEAAVVKARSLPTDDSGQGACAGGTAGEYAQEAVASVRRGAGLCLICFIDMQVKPFSF